MLHDISRRGGPAIKLGRTNFAVYEESVVELPNFIMYIYPFTDVLEYGKGTIEYS